MILEIIFFCFFAQNQQRAILINLDSKTFLQVAGKLPYTCVVPGEIIPVDNKNNNNSVMCKQILITSQQ